MKQALYRFLINWYQAGDKPLPRWLEQASEKDKSLAKERAFGDELTRSLRERPNEAPRIAEDSMVSRVMRQITEEDYQAEQSRGPVGEASGGWLRTAGLVAMACAAIALAVQVWLPRSGDDVPVTPIAGVDHEVTEELVDALEADKLLALGEDWKNPLDQEIEYVISDAKGALDFLATSFVPSGMLKKVERKDQA